MCGGTGEWETECCNGYGGCSCRGQRAQMGTCNVCHGYGQHSPTADRDANLRAIAGYHFAGTGPNDMFDVWPNRMGRSA